jgi:choline-glycine betaine transporter
MSAEEYVLWGYGIIGVIFVIAVIFLAISKYNKKQKENFQKRDN